MPLEHWTNDPLFHTIMSPVGSVTDAHDDGVLQTGLLVQVYGEKILFTWEPTEANRKYLSGCHGTEHGLKLKGAIERMADGFKVNILKPGVGVKMAPGMIHAIISTTNSAIGCWEYVDAKWLDDHKIEEGVEWEVGLIKSRKALPTDVRPENMYMGLRYGVSLWRCLKLKLENRQREDFKDYTDKVELLLDFLESRLPKADIQSTKTRRSNARGNNPKKQKRRQG